ncbi:MAG: DOPA 4,5-dioxygenase family protein [Rhodospirillales bacterium]|nr:DOPA 4,5-dioxygenase family protein [Rhodospirillales bacterium]
MADITGYHAHVYYDATTKPIASVVRNGLAQHFPDTALGRWHDDPVGPHPMGSYQITFSPAQFATIVPWLSFHRQGLIVLVHPETGDDLTDHTERAIWMGDMPELDITAFEGGP